MNAAAEARQAELDRAIEAHKLTTGFADELFAVADLLSQQATLRNALADTTTPDAQRRGMAEAIFAKKVTKATVAVLAEAASLRWGTGSRLAAAIDRQGLRVLFGAAQAAGTLDRVEEELFRFSRAVVADPELRAALDNRNASLAVRQQLVADLVGKKADPITVKLAQRALAFVKRAFEPTVDAYLTLAAETRQRAVATVTVARPLSEEQQQRLQQVLIGRLNRQVTLQVVVDPNVLGGARVKVGDEVIEGTVAGRLAAAEQQLTQ
ncbi:MAG: F0F1 ATP synthase subunit delta [Actinobacteria bacterium HGW-Actinobacteria-2]|nr:MAG: F0F1 ATP synthase subunit delta [Actinobacteria bacterium HGW-Actinobacteria-2]